MADVQCDAELHVLGAVRADLARRIQRDVDVAIRHAELRKNLVDGATELLRGFGAHRRQLRGAFL